MRLVEGVAEHAARIDELIDTHATNWSIDRLPDVDRAILRMAVFELLWADDVPDVVVIDEAVELAKTLSTDDSPRLRQRRPRRHPRRRGAHRPEWQAVGRSSVARGPEGSGAESRWCSAQVGTAPGRGGSAERDSVRAAVGARSATCQGPRWERGARQCVTARRGG